MYFLGVLREFFDYHELQFSVELFVNWMSLNRGRSNNEC